MRHLPRYLCKYPRKTSDGDTLHILLFIIQQFQEPIQQLRLLQVLNAQVLINCLELFSDFLPHLEVEVLAHDGDFLGPPNREVVAGEVFHRFPQKVGSVDSSHEWLRLITQLHASIYGVPQVIRR